MRDADGFTMNLRYKSLRSREDIVRFLLKNPTMRIYDTTNRENRFVVRNARTPSIPTGITVDGRSFRAAYFALAKTEDGGYTLEEAETVAASSTQPSTTESEK